MGLNHQSILNRFIVQGGSALNLIWRAMTHFVQTPARVILQVVNLAVCEDRIAREKLMEGLVGAGCHVQNDGSHPLVLLALARGLDLLILRVRTLEACISLRFESSCKALESQPQRDWFVFGLWLRQPRALSGH